MILLAKPTFTQLTGESSGFFMDSLNVFLKVIFTFKTVRADGTNVCFCTIFLLVNRGLMNRHDVCTQMMALQKALVAQMTSVRLYLGMHCQNVL